MEKNLSLQYCKLIREQNENAEKWMGYLRIKVNECGYGIIRELKIIKKRNEVTSEEVLAWVRTVEEQKAQKVLRPQKKIKILTLWKKQEQKNNT